ncbi:phosphopyruvate hydratase [Candidatus Woesearchaeota archaeon CG_4_10_14_0_2_um_filter_33_13]|nr:MAG: phosphopyruvate hydratase [Candidatus Woesearchaeota archaeon CG_4_10_14_0_2_um_filter_33_13]
MTKINAREILDSRGNPTIEVDVFTKSFVGRASVPSGASTGVHEALELRDKTKRYLGKGVQKAIKNVHQKIAPLLIGVDCTKQRKIDTLMIEKDGTDNKIKLGANAILAVSLACARAGAQVKNQQLFEHINQLVGDEKIRIPRPFFNIINGGKHADNNLSVQEFMIAPKFKSFGENLRVASEIYHTLKKELKKIYGGSSTNVGDEGGFAPVKINKVEEALMILVKSIRDAGYSGKVEIAMDCAASEFYSAGRYHVDSKKLKKEELIKFYLSLIKKYPLISIEDPFEQEAFEDFAELTKSTNIQIVGDDLTVTNVDRIQEAIKEKSCNCLLLKVNQIGSLTEALDAVRMAYDNGWKVMVSHRSGETEDSFIADLAVGIGCGMIKSGAPCRGERTAKYNQLLRIEETIQKR